jgi:hypothetical protein
MPITLNHSNIGVQYNTGSNYIIETVKSDLYLRNEIYDTIVSNNLQTAPVTPSIYIENTSNVYAVESYTYSGSANTADYTRVFPKNTVCDILIVGGGGGGSAGGGGGGGYVYNTNITLNGTYSIKTGKGGAGATGSTGGSQGTNSSLIGGSISYTAYGGGGGAGNGVIAPAHTTGQVGSYGGSGHDFTTAQTYTSTQGNRGGRAIYNSGGGGGGSGAVGNDGSVFFNNLYSQTGVVYYYRGGQGGIGLSNNITGSDVYYAGGGTAGVNTNRDTDTSPHELVLGGGGIGARAPNANGGNGTNGLGGGGGGGDWERTAGTTGGSGIVIIRYLLGTIPSTNLLTSEPTVISPVITETVRTFKHSGGTETQTAHTITVGQNTICDILIIGGGGAGGTYIGAGGGAGGVLYIQNATVPSGTYNIQIGKGGTGFNGMGNSTTAQNGSSSKAFGIEVFGGGYGGSGGWGAGGIGQTGGSGGSSGGGGSTYDISVSFGSGGSIIQPSFTSSLIKVNTYNYYGGNGAAGYRHSGSGAGVCSNGGGGAGGNALVNTNESNAGNGADGIAINITGISYFWGGGGGGGQYAGSKAGNGGKGGGGGGNGSQATEGVGIGGTGGITLGQDGDPEGDGTPTAGNGGAGTGGGGGGTGRTTGSPNAVSGSGGSGIVIIKFKSIVGAGILDGITHKRLTYVYNSDNLVAWYKFNGDYLDSSGNGHNLTNVGTVIQSTHIIEGQAVEFDSTDYLEFPASINPYTIWNGKGISFSCWVRFTAHETWARLFDFQTAVSTASGFYVAVKSNWGGTPGAILVNVAEGTLVTYSNWSNSIITTLGVWHHFVWSIGISGNWDVYLDNVRINGTETANIPNITYNIRYINRSAFSVDGTWDGQMDDFRIYDRALSAADVSSLYNKTYSLPPNTYTLNFPVPTIADINNNSNIVLRGAYDISLSTSNALIIPKTGQYIHSPTLLIKDGEERIYPPVRNFTTDTTIVSGQPYGNGTYIVSASTFNSGEDAFRIFNGTNSGWTQVSLKYDGSPAGTYTGLLSLGGFSGEWIKVQFPVSIKLTKYIIEASATGGVNRAPSVYKIFGSNNNIDWEQVVYKSVPLVSADYISSKYEEKVSSNNYYRFFALVVGKNIGTDTWLGIGELYIYGREFVSNSLSIRYNLLNPVLDPIGAQWTYNSSNTNVYHMGNVGIGTKSPEYNLDVRGSIYSSLGGYTQTGLTTWSIASDRRIKENIVKASYEKCLDNVKNIELYNFNFKDNCVNTNDKHQLGFIAQEVQQVYPKAVEVSKMILNTNETIDDLLSLNTTQIDYTLYGAVKNLIEKIEDIDNELGNIERNI